MEIIENTMTTAVDNDKYRSAGIETCESYSQVVAYLWEARREFGCENYRTFQTDTIVKRGSAILDYLDREL